MVHSILDRVTRADIRYEPYPHIIVPECLPPDYYGQLSDQYPSDELILELRPARKPPRGQNQRNNIAAAKAFEHPFRIAQVWMEFISFHLSPRFHSQVISLFGPEIRSIYPHLEDQIGRRLEDCRCGVRSVERMDIGEISLDCQIGIDTPVETESSVRRVHTDSVDELFAGLLYFRRPEDDSKGGDLEIYRWKDGCGQRFRGSGVDEEDAQYVRTIPYRANTLVMFVNSPQSLHAVSARSVTPHSRRLVNVIGEVYRSVPQGLFAKHQKDPGPS